MGVNESSIGVLSIQLLDTFKDNGVFELVQFTNDVIRNSFN